MCGRFNVTSTPGLQALLQGLGSDLVLPAPKFNLAPTELAPLIINDESQVVLREARWWLTPHWSKELSQKYAMFNARCEGLSKSPAFRKPFACQRGVVPMSGFIEWRGEKGNKQPWLVSTEDESMAVAALWDLWRSDDSEDPLLSCSIVTTAAAPSFEAWHKRMPVVLKGSEIGQWMDNRSPIDTADPLFDARLKEPWIVSPVDRAVGNSRNKAEVLMHPIGDRVRLSSD